jgi:hypothetical protein
MYSLLSIVILGIVASRDCCSRECRSRDGRSRNGRSRNGRFRDCRCIRKRYNTISLTKNDNFPENFHINFCFCLLCYTRKHVVFAKYNIWPVHMLYIHGADPATKSASDDKILYPLRIGRERGNERGRGEDMVEGAG